MGDFPYAYWKGGMLNLHFTSVKGVLVSLRGGLRLEGVCEEQHKAGGGGRERKLPMTTPSQLKYIVHIWLSVLE